MALSLVTVRPDVTVEQAMHVMRNNRISSVLVQPDEKGDWSIMTQKDVLIKLIHANRSPSSVKVNQIASKPLATVPVDLSLHECVTVMKERNIRRLVVEKDGVPIGIVSDTDIFRTVEKFGWSTGE
nr:CBS domain-containing protein [Thioflexithrix psekupsensis]